MSGATIQMSLLLADDGSEDNPPSVFWFLFGVAGFVCGELVCVCVCIWFFFFRCFVRWHWQCWWQMPRWRSSPG